MLNQNQVDTKIRFDTKIYHDHKNNEILYGRNTNRGRGKSEIQI